MVMKGYSAFPKVPDHWNLTIRLFCVICRKLIWGGAVLPLCRGAVSVFYSPSWLGHSLSTNLFFIYFALHFLSLKNWFFYPDVLMSFVVDRYVFPFFLTTPFLLQGQAKWFDTPDFLSHLYDSTLDWTPVTRTIAKHSNHYAIKRGAFDCGVWATHEIITDDHEHYSKSHCFLYIGPGQITK